MAVTLLNQNDDQAKKGQNPLNPGQMNLGSSAPAGGSSAPATGAQNTPAPSATPQGSGRFTNIQKYLNANKTGGQQIAGNIQNNFNKQASQVQQGVQNAQTNLTRNAQPLATQLGAQGQQQIQQGFQDPNALVNDANKLAEFQNLAGGMTQNLSNLSDTERLRQAQLAQQNSALQQTAQLAGTEAGRFELLRKTMGSPTYSQGAQRLDQVLLGSQPNVTAGLQNNLNSAVTANQQGLAGLEQNRIAQLSDLKNLSDQRQAQWQGLLTDGVTANSLDTDLNNRGLADILASSQQRLAAAQADQAALPQLKARLANNTLTQEDMPRLGLTAGTQLWDVDPSQFVTKGADPTLNSAASVDEVNRYNQLRKLAGIDQTQASAFGDGSNIGSYTGAGFNQDAFKQALNTSAQKFQVGNVQQIIDQMNRAGYFGGQSSGSGMRAADPGAAMRQATGEKMAQLQRDYDAGRVSAADFYQGAINAVNQGWAPWGGLDAMTRYYDGLYDDLANYGAVIKNNQRTLGAAPQPAALPTVANPTPGNTIDWTAIKNQMANSGYTLPTNKGPEVTPVDDPLLKKK